jgi:hypothetical protein
LAFDVFRIAVSVSDVITDCLVAHQFWVQGRTTFFWLVVASLMLLQVRYTVVGVEVVLRLNWGTSLHVPAGVSRGSASVGNWLLEHRPSRENNRSATMGYTFAPYKRRWGALPSGRLLDEVQAAATANSGWTAQTPGWLGLLPHAFRVVGKLPF